ncbi:MAG: DUF1836 domain-containing protein [Clostridiales bacterium]|nr:DUF1836 domain-containing protein [Clostridiales bacterium]
MKEEKHLQAVPVEGFRLPRYAELPTVGLYLEQITRYVNDYLAKAGCAGLTASMVSNYVKQKTVPPPVKKAYGADAIACLLYVAFVKRVMPMEDVRLLWRALCAQRPLPETYDGFCAALEAALRAAFGLRAEPEPDGAACTAAVRVLHTAVRTAAQQLYLDSCLCRLRGEQPR